MRTVHDLPEAVVVDESVFIPMADGVHLAAKVWRPKHGRPVPAILEYIPYFKRFGTADRDAITHGYLAGHDYACVRVDIRGSGESEGVLTDEYLAQELEDGVAVIAWIAEQAWCDGNVGMMGISWGGFNALQVAALQPPALKAIITLCSTDDRYSDDIHHMGGCLLGDSLSWAAVMFGYTSMPPDPALVGDKWREMWQQRLDHSGLWLEKWLRHQRRDSYWQHGSICEDYRAVQCPVFAASGWTDGYSNAVFRLMKNLDVPRKGLIGPWSHRYPHFGSPGPAIGFLQECLRWWDQWLKGRDTGIMDEPVMRVWMQESMPPNTSYDYRPGRWVGEPTWPSPHLEERVIQLTPTGMQAGRPELDDKAEASVMSPLSVGLYAGKWCSYAAGPDLAYDQREEDGGALVFECWPLSEPVELLGAPVAELEVSVDKPVAMVAARLSDVRPNNEATRISYGLLNLTHRNGNAEPEPVEPGKRYRIRIHLNQLAQQIPAGHRLRLSLSTSYWPLAWPAPEPVCLKVHLAKSALRLPVRPPRPDEDAALRPFDTPEGAPVPPRTILKRPEHSWKVHRDLATDLSELEVIDDRGVRHLEDIDLTVGERGEERYRSRGGDFNSIHGETLWQRSLQRGSWQIRTVTHMRMHATAEAFHIRARLDAYETDALGERRVTCRSWTCTIPRDLL